MRHYITHNIKERLTVGQRILKALGVAVSMVVSVFVFWLFAVFALVL